MMLGGGGGLEMIAQCQKDLVLPIYFARYVHVCIFVCMYVEFIICKYNVRRFYPSTCQLPLPGLREASLQILYASGPNGLAFP